MLPRLDLTQMMRPKQSLALRLIAGGYPGSEKHASEGKNRQTRRHCIEWCRDALQLAAGGMCRRVEGCYATVVPAQSSSKRMKHIAFSLSRQLYFT